MAILGKFLTAAVSGVFAAALATSVQAQQPLKLRMAWSVTPAQLAPILFEPPGVTRHNGKSYALEPIRFPGSAQTLQALGAGELEIAPITFNILGPTILNAGMTDVRIIADEFRDGYEDYDSNLYMVLKDGPIKSVADMKGKVFATNGIGGGQDIFARVMMRKNGLEYPRDYTMIEATFPTMGPMLLEKKADMVVGVKPFTEIPTFKNNARTLFTQKEAIGPSDQIFMIAREPFIQKNRAVLVDFFEDYIRSLRWYRDPANHAAVVEIVSKYIKVPPQQLGWIFTKQDFYRDPNASPDLESVQKSLDMLKEFNFIKGDIDVKKFSDLSIIQEAAARIK